MSETEFCSGRYRFQVLVFQPELSHSTWEDFYSRRRSLKTLIKELRDMVKRKECVGYRIITIHEESIGVTWK